MKKLIQINTVCNTSTGRIMGDIQRAANKLGYETLSFVGRRKVFQDIRCEKFGNPVSFWIHVALTTVFDRQGFGSYFTTKKLVRRLRAEKPDIIHLHNLHGYYLNLPVLFQYLSEEFQGQIFWSFHDCWPFTGHCPHFAARNCDKWRTGCYACQEKREYPISLLFDSSSRNYRDKKRLFCNLNNLVIITPSEWMAGWIRQSFFSKYPIKVIYNGINLKLFSYRKPEDAFYEEYDIDRSRKILLGVASVWNKRKGLADFISLASKLPEEYQIILVGLSKRQISALPYNVRGITRTENVEELIRFYSAAHIFINPSVEESFSLVTIEAIACGTPVIVLDTSAVKELVNMENGIILGKHNAEEYLQAITDIEDRKMNRHAVMKTAEKYDVDCMAANVLQLYKETLGRNL